MRVGSLNKGASGRMRHIAGYDGKQPLCKRANYSGGSSGYTVTSDIRYIYDGMLVVQERTWSTHSHCYADGNGNITYLVNSSQSSVAAPKQCFERIIFKTSRP
jgi:hypothetical protein